jgi:D-alanyl-D-alanine carboxypeptidase
MKAHRFAVLALCLLLAASAAAESLPDTPAGKAAAGWIAAHNSGDRAQLEQFLSANYTAEALKNRPAEQRARSIQQMRTDNGPLEVVKVLASSDNEIEVVTLAPETETRLLLRVRLEQGKIPGISINNNAAGTAARLRDAELPARLTAYLKKLEDRERFSGVVLVARDGKVLFQEAHGKASESGAAINLDTRFNLASMNKMMTAVAMAQLAQQGKLKLTDTIAQHLPDYPNQEVARKVTVGQLLNHTSGIGNYMKPEFFKTELKTLKDYLPFFANDPLQFEPGKGWSYSNAAFIVACMVIEKVSGMDYFTYIEKHVFAPAGMTASGFFTRDEKVANRAFGLTRADSPDGRRHSAEPMLPWRGGPAGGGYSTAGDLLKFATALRSHKLLDPTHTEMITTITSRAEGSGPNEGYGYGFGVDVLPGGERLVGHGGGFPGTNTNLQIFLKSGYTVVVLTNYDPPAAERVSNWIISHLESVPDRAGD